MVIAGIVRTIYLVRIETNDPDKSWNGFNVFVAGIAELNLGIICACAPSLKYLFQGPLRDLATKRSTSSGNSSWFKDVTSHLNSRFKRSGKSVGSNTSWKDDNGTLEIKVDKNGGFAEAQDHVNVTRPSGSVMPVLSPASTRSLFSDKEHTDLIEQKS